MEENQDRNIWRGNRVQWVLPGERLNLMVPNSRPHWKLLNVNFIRSLKDCLKKLAQQRIWLIFTINRLFG
jgi:hypothetical protein